MPDSLTLFWWFTSLVHDWKHWKVSESWSLNMCCACRRQCSKGMRCRGAKNSMNVIGNAHACPGTSTPSSWILPQKRSCSANGRCRQVPCLPRKVKIDVVQCHACHKHTALQARHQSQPSAVSAMPATQSDGRCDQVPHLPRKVMVDETKCHACHANGRGDHGGKRDPSASPEPAQCHKCHACHAKWESMSPSATPTTQNEGRCDQVPRLPRKRPRRPRRQTGPKRVTRSSPMP